MNKESIGLAHGVINLNVNDKKIILDYFKNGIKIENQLFKSIIIKEHFFLTSEKLRYPPIFYLIHSAAFYVNIMRNSGIDIKSVNKKIETYFAHGVDPHYLEEPPQLVFTPSLAEAWEYRELVFDQVESWFINHNLEKQIEKGSESWAFLMCMEHQRIHIETSALIIRQIPTAHLQRPSDWLIASWDKNSPTSEYIEITAAKIEIGCEYNTDIFSWDNEVGRKTAFVDQFYVSKYLVTNSDFLEFIKAGAYKTNEFWSSKGISWREYTQGQAPLFWEENTPKVYKYRSTFEQHDFPYNWPVETNYYEAQAFANWKSSKGPYIYRLMTDLEFYRINSKEYASGFSNTNIKFGSSTGVNFHADDLINDTRGNVWQWLKTSFYPLEGFEIDSNYPTFSFPYFDNQHKMLLGGSWISTGTQQSAHYRLWFREYIYQNAGFRLIRELK